MRARPARRARHGTAKSACRANPRSFMSLSAPTCRVLLSCPPPFPIAVATGPGGRAAMVWTGEAPQPQAAVQTMCSATARRTTCSAARSSCVPRPQGLRAADHGGDGNGTEVPAVERCRIGRTEQEQLAVVKPPAMPPGRQWTVATIGCADAGARAAVDANDVLVDAHLLRRQRGGVGR